MIREFLSSCNSIGVLIHLSDEWSGNPKKWWYGEGIELYHFYPQLVLRQYDTHPYINSLMENITKVVHVPLGYMRTMLDNYIDKSTNQTLTSMQVTWTMMHRLSSNRQYNWSFIGSLQGHKGRLEAIEIFSDWKNFSRPLVGTSRHFNIIFLILFCSILFCFVLFNFTHICAFLD